MLSHTSVAKISLSSEPWLNDRVKSPAEWEAEFVIWCHSNPMPSKKGLKGTFQASSSSSTSLILACRVTGMTLTWESSPAGKGWAWFPLCCRYPCSVGSSSLPLVSLQAGCEHCFTTLGLNSGVPLPIQLLFVPQEPLWTVFPGSQREILYLLSLHCIHTLPIPSSKYGFVKVWYGLCCVSSDALPKSNLGFVIPCLMKGCFQSIDFGATAPVYLRGLGCWWKCGVVVRSGVCPGVSSWCPEQLVIEELLVLLLTISFAFWWWNSLNSSVSVKWR